MLSNLDLKLIEKEKEKFERSYHIKLQPCILDRSTINNLLKYHNCHEYTFHWYDKDPDECDQCKKSWKHCENCNIHKGWWYPDNKKRKTYCNWIDVEGPGIWEATLEEANDRVKQLLFNILNDSDHYDRLFYAQVEKENEGKFFFIFYYNRDRVPECRDIWFVLKQK